MTELESLMPKTREYIRLPGHGTRRTFLSFTISGGRCTLWQGKHHLLAVESQGFTERYKRFYFQDIQAFIIRQTKAMEVWSGVVLLFLILCGVIVALTSDRIGQGIAGSCGGVLLLVLIINLVRGPGVVCHICTAVHVEELPSIKRLRTARKVMARLKPLIEQAQGALSADAIQSAVLAMKIGAHPQPSPVRLQEPLAHDDGHWHQALFLLLVVKAGMTATGYYHNSTAVGVANVLGVLAVGVVAVIAIVRQQHTDVTEGIRRLVIASTVYVGINIIASYIVLITIMAKSPRLVRTQWDMFKAFTETSPQLSAFQTVVHGGLFLLALGLGTSGLFLVHQFRKRSFLRPSATQESIAPVVAEGND